MFRYENSITVSNSRFDFFTTTVSPLCILKAKSSVELDVVECCFFHCTCNPQPGAIYAQLKRVNVTKSHFHKMFSNIKAGISLSLHSEDYSSINHISIYRSQSNYGNYGDINMRVGNIFSQYSNTSKNLIDHITFMYSLPAVNKKTDMSYIQVIGNKGINGVEYQNENSTCKARNLIFVNNTASGDYQEGYTVVRQWKRGSMDLDNSFFFGNTRPIIARALSTNEPSAIGTISVKNVYADTKDVYSATVSSWHDYSVTIFPWGQTYWCHYRRCSIPARNSGIFHSLFYSLVNFVV